MTPHLDLPHVALAALTCILLSLAGGMFQSREALAWLAGRRRAAWHLPSAVLFVVQALVYLIEGVILYRLLESDVVPSLRVVALGAMLVMMVAAEGVPSSLLALRSTAAGMAAALVFLAPLAVAELALWSIDHTSALLLVPYCAWVVLYVTPWAVSLHRLNRPDAL